MYGTDWEMILTTGKSKKYLANFIQTFAELEKRLSVPPAAWAGLSEKTADVIDSALKYGGGPEEVRSKLDELSDVIAGFESSIEPVAIWSDIAQELKKSLHDRISGVTARLGARS